MSDSRDVQNSHHKKFVSPFFFSTIPVTKTQLKIDPKTRSESLSSKTDQNENLKLKIKKTNPESQWFSTFYSKTLDNEEINLA